VSQRGLQGTAFANGYRDAHLELQAFPRFRPGRPRTPPSCPRHGHGEDPGPDHVAGIAAHVAKPETGDPNSEAETRSQKPETRQPKPDTRTTLSQNP